MCLVLVLFLLLFADVDAHEWGLWIDGEDTAGSFEVPVLLYLTISIWISLDVSSGS